MNDETWLRIRHTFDRLLAGGREPTGIDRLLMEVFERLMHGLPEVSDVKITIVNLTDQLPKEAVSDGTAAVMPVLFGGRPVELGGVQ